jgi:hypothetical protein
MKFLRFVSLFLLGLLTLALAAFAALWFLNPTAPKVDLADAGPDGVRIAEGGIIANYFAPEGEGTHPGILLLGGSEGGLGAGVARLGRALRDEGYAVLQLSYFRGPGQPGRLELVPLELFEQALDLLAARPEVDASRLAIIGGSKGAEAALIIAARRPDIRAVVAGMPSSVSWQGIDWNVARMIVDPPGASWSLGGAPFPFLPYGRPEKPGGPIIDVYRAGLANLAEHPDAIIAVETIRAPVLLVCGEADTLWPSCPMAEDVRRRAEGAGGPPVAVLAFKDAGHAVFGIALEDGDPRFERLASLGGTPQGNNLARRESWLAILSHLGAALE